MCTCSTAVAVRDARAVGDKWRTFLFFSSNLEISRETQINCITYYFAQRVVYVKIMLCKPTGLSNTWASSDNSFQSWSQALSTCSPPQAPGLSDTLWSLSDSWKCRDCADVDYCLIQLFQWSSVWRSISVDLKCAVDSCALAALIVAKAAAANPAM